MFINPKKGLSLQGTKINKMADITMCEGKGCECKHTCYRHKAKPNKHRQSYFMESPIKDSGCEYYWNFEGQP